ncbi:MAG: AI-2E family transporter [Burkholderiales bacterium]|jgi:AI-2 transport protein TqsA|nr:AI-2E family transporter [Burkholderiales bacterium]
MQRLQIAVYSTILILITGWLLYIGKSIFVPVVLGAVVVYVIVGLADSLGRLPGIGPRLPVQARYFCSLAAIGMASLALAYLVVANKQHALERAPYFQQSVLALLQQLAVFFGVEKEPTWASLRQELLAHVNMQRVLTSMFTSLGSILMSFVVVFLYATFLLIERQTSDQKLANLADNPNQVARIRAVLAAINQRIGSYLALKTVISLLLGLVSYGVMRLLNLDFAALWAVLTVLLNFVPYVGSVLGVALPALMATVQFSDLGTVLTLLALLVAVHFAIGNFLDPYVMGNSLNLSPFAILISLGVWSELWGIAGAFLAVPITAILTIVFSEFPATRPLAVLLSRDGRV